MQKILDLKKIIEKNYRFKPIDLSSFILVWAKSFEKEFDRFFIGSGLDSRELCFIIEKMHNKNITNYDLLELAIKKSFTNLTLIKDLLSVLIDNPEHISSKFLIENGLNLNKLKANILKIEKSMSIDTFENTFELEKSESVEKNNLFLDLIALSKLGKFSYLSDRNEVELIIDNLLKMDRNSTIILGDSGVGKSTLIRLLANRIVSKNLPKALQKKKLVEINIGNLISGTKYRGDLERKLYYVIDYCKKNSAILFIDEIHMIMGNSSSGDNLNIANILKSEITSGLCILGATTVSEFNSTIAKDPAIVRRFNIINLKKPNEVDIKNAIFKRVENLSKHYNLIIDQKLLEDKYEFIKVNLGNNFTLDKILDLLELSCIKAIKLKKQFLDFESISEVLTQFTNNDFSLESIKLFDQLIFKNFGLNLELKKLTSFFSNKLLTSDSNNFLFFHGHSNYIKNKVLYLINKSVFFESPILTLNLIDYEEDDIFIIREKLMSFYTNNNKGILFISNIEKINFKDKFFRLCKQIISSKQFLIIFSTNFYFSNDFFNIDFNKIELPLIRTETRNILINQLGLLKQKFDIEVTFDEVKVLDLITNIIISEKSLDPDQALNKYIFSEIINILSFKMSLKKINIVTNEKGFSIVEQS